MKKAPKERSLRRKKRRRKKKKKNRWLIVFHNHMTCRDAIAVTFLDQRVKMTVRRSSVVDNARYDAITRLTKITLRLDKAFLAVSLVVTLILSTIINTDACIYSEVI